MRPRVSAAFDHSRVSKCVKQIARLILAQELKAGDRLPPQQDLRRLLGASNDTLSSAMARLVDMGVLTRKRLVGTVVSDLSAMASINWSVGLATFVASDRGPAAFFSDLHHRFLVALSRANCRGMTYYRVEHPAWPQRISDFPGLDEDIANRHLDGLLTMTDLAPTDWQRIESNGIALVRVGPSLLIPPCGVTIDTTTFEHEAAEAFARHGCARCSLVTTLGEQATARSRQLAQFSDVTPVLLPGIEAGHELAVRLLARPREQRPDGLAVTDDYTAMGLTRILAEDREYRPCVVVLTNCQLPLEFSMPVIRLELDSDELVTKAIALLKDSLTGREVEERVQSVAPRLARGRGNE